MKKLKWLVMTAAFAAPATAHAAPAERLNYMNTQLLLIQNFDQMKTAPQWRSGGTQVGAAMKPFNDKTFSWAAGYIWNHAVVGTKVTWPPARTNFPAWTSNTNANADPNGDMIARMDPALSPLQLKDGALNMIARPMPADLAKTISASDPKGYMGASIVSYPYSQLYGIFTIVAKVPKGKGLWPSFWLLPYDLSWPPELDIAEVLGSATTTLVNTVHIPNGYGGDAAQGHATTAKWRDLSADFHTYTVDWGPDKIKWYLDDILVAQQATPAQMKKPCYLILDLAVGLPWQWGGAPDSKTVFPAKLLIKSVSVWQRPQYVPAPAAAAVKK